MNKMKHIFLLIFCICFVGCRTQKATLTQDISTTEQTSVDAQNETQNELQIWESETGTDETEQSRTEEMTIIEYSVPDTGTGLQFITRITVKNSKDEIIRKAVIERLKSINEVTETVEQKHENTNIQKEENTTLKEQTKMTTPAWIYLTGAIIIAVILIVIYIFIKKFIKQ